MNTLLEEVAKVVFEMDLESTVRAGVDGGGVGL